MNRCHDMKSQANFKLDRSLFNTGLYDAILRLWLPTYPNPSSHFTREDVLRWFAQSMATDEKVRAIGSHAIASINPESFTLPPFTSLEADKALYDEIAAPFISYLDELSEKITADSVDLPFNIRYAALALTLLIDQFPRNLFRGEAQATVYTHFDRIARAVAAQIDARGLNNITSLTDAPVWRYWFFLPLEHSESVTDHNKFRGILSEALQHAKNLDDKMGIKFLEQALSFENKHYQPLLEFGRFPWRNKWLGRESTEAEKAWLEERGDKFGSG